MSPESGIRRSPLQTLGLLGSLVNRLGRRQALSLFGVLQSASVAGYAWLALGTPKRAALYLLCSAEHFAGGMATAALFTRNVGGRGRRRATPLPLEPRLPAAGA